MLVNAEGLPIEGIDRIEITLNPELNYFIIPQNKYIDPKHYLHLRRTNKYGIWWFLDIQAQFINNYLYDIRAAIAKSIYILIEKRFLDFPYSIDYQFIYTFLDYFVYVVREIEFYFDFEPKMINVINNEELIKYKDTLYSVDRRLYKNKPARKSILEDYNHNDKLKSFNQIQHKDIFSNKYSQRIEFRLTKYNCPYRTLENLMGSQHNIITRYIPYLAILYHNFFLRSIFINPIDHPYFSNILLLSQREIKRYRGPLGKKETHKPSQEEINFFCFMRMMQLNKSNYFLYSLMNDINNG